MPTITTAITNPIGTAIVTGTLTFTANTTLGTVLKGTSATVVPGTNIILLAGTYKVYYLNADGLNQYIGEIIVAAIDATLTSLLEAM